MVFSSAVFLLLFLPAVLICYYNPFFRGREFKNVLLLLASLFFYAWGEPFFVMILMLSILLNYGFGRLIAGSDPALHRTRRRGLLLLSLCYNVGLLAVFKYMGFFADNLSLLVGRRVNRPELALPIGLSFFTFQMLSYILDVYWEKAPVQKNVLHVGLYISMFPQLVAGPIVRYETIAAEITGRKENRRDFSEGVERFLVGLGKKVLIANYVAGVADICFAKNGGGELTAAGAWLGAAAYTLQIYFDFSGYSDMAIGLGKMFGFHFLENFNFPYISASITEFWRRWHISLSSWFRDYIYIPLGGNRRGKGRMFFNLLVVWTLTGLWHGANWTFVVWGLLYFVLLALEKITGLNRRKSWFGHVYTLFFVNLAWVVFRAEDLAAAGTYLGTMFGFGAAAGIGAETLLLLKNSWTVLLAACIGCLPVSGWMRKQYADKRWYGVLRQAWLLFLFAMSLAACVKASYSPFIYFNF